MSAAAAAATNSRKNPRDDDEDEDAVVLPAKKAAVEQEQECKCDQCDLRSQIHYFIVAALEVVDDCATVPDASTATEEKRIRAMRANIGCAASGITRLMGDLLPTDERRQTRPALSGRDFRNLLVRNDFTRLQKQCKATDDFDDDNDGAGAAILSSNDMFQFFRALVRGHLATAKDRIETASNEQFDDTLIEFGTMAHIIAFSSFGLGCCRRAFQKLRELSSELKHVIDSLASCPVMSDCVMRRQPRAPAVYQGGDDSDTDVDTVPEVQAPVELPGAAQDPRADSEGAAYQA